MRKIIDSRGKATVEADIRTKEGFGRAAAPSGASTGKHEVVAFPDKGGPDGSIQLFTGEYSAKIIGHDAADQKGLDALLHEIDGTPNFRRIGGNAAIAISLAAAKAEASGQGLQLYEYVSKKLAGTGGKYSLPMPFGNILGGGKHAIGGTDIQEYLAVAHGKTFSQSAFCNAKVHSQLATLIKPNCPTMGRGDEGAWVVGIGNRDAMEKVAQACRLVADRHGIKVEPALDVAASSFFERGAYAYKEGPKKPKEQVEFMASLVSDYNLHSVEDPLDEDAWDDWAELTRAVGKKALVIGDDLFVTDPERVKKGIKMGAANAVLVKVNQIGTLTQTLEVVALAHSSGMKTVISHRSGETTDDTIAHLAVALGCHGIKTGTVGGERTAKLNELIRIEEMISGK